MDRNFFNLNNKGQLSIEFLLILLIILILIEVIIIPLRDYSRDSVLDMFNVNTLDKGLEEINSKYSLLQNYSSGKFNVEIELPKDSNFYCANTNIIGYSYKLISQNEEYDAELNKLCENFICSRELTIPCTFTNKTTVENKLTFNLIVNKVGVING
jgi:uncharacterized protein (UPF0333 family)